MTSSKVWDEEIARRYDEHCADMFAPEVIGPTVDFLARLADGGRALELAVGTGRVAVPLAHRSVPVVGIELSEAMVAQLRAKVDEETVPVVVGDMARASAPGEFSLVYLVFNTISNLLTQAEQVACFRNAARHLAPGGRFVIELWVPALRKLPPGAVAVPFAVSERRLGFDTYDLAAQLCTSHHLWEEDGLMKRSSADFRYLWPGECDLMAELAGLELEQRVADWHGAPFTNESESHVSVWRKPPA